MGTESYEYEHIRFRPGLPVRIDPAIRIMHPLSPIVGKVGVTCAGTAYKLLDLFEDQTANVPVRFPSGGETYYVEEQFVIAMI